MKYTIAKMFQILRHNRSRRYGGDFTHRSAVPVRYQGHIYPECDRTVFYRSVA